MESLLAEQKINQVQLETFIRNLKRTPKERRTTGHLRKRHEILEELWGAIKKTHRNMLENYKEDIHTQFAYFKEDVHSALEEMYFDAHGILYEFIKEAEPQTHSTTSSSQPSTTQFSTPIIVQQKENTDLPLPRINIPTFSGGYQNWPSFRDLFEGLIHNNRNVTKVQKLHYLHSSLSGEAKQLIKHLQISEINYDPAWELLRKRYQNERALINAQLHVLTSLPTQVTETATGIKKFLDNLNECLEGLKSLKIDINSWNPILLYLLTQKLNRDTVAQWELALSNRIKPNDLPTTAEFTEFLETRFRTLDAINRVKGQPSHKESHAKANFPTTTEPRTAQAFTANTHTLCPLCNMDHRLKQCVKFLSMSPKTRFDFIRSDGRCINCLSKSHSVKSCPNTMSCQHCRKRHNTLLHFNAPIQESSRQVVQHQPQNSKVGFRHKNQYSNQCRSNQYKTHHISQPNLSSPRSEDSSQQGIGYYPVNNQSRNLSYDRSNNILDQPMLSESNQVNSIQSYCLNQNKCATVLLATAVVKISSSKGGTQPVRVLLDQGSQASFITEEAVQRLRLSKQAIHATVSGICDPHGKISRSIISCVIQPYYSSTFERVVEAYVLPRITGILPSQSIDPATFTYLNGLQLADPQFMNPGHIDMLLGADIVADILLEGIFKGPHGYPIAQNTTLGWIISGNVPTNIASHYTTPTISVSCNAIEISELESLLRRFWEVEEVTIQRKLTPEEEISETLFQKTHYRRPDGRYVVPLTFKNGELPQLGESRNTAKRRLLQMERQFSANPILFEEYKSFMQEYLSLGHMEKITPSFLENNNTCNEYFLPHHAVIKESSTTTKLRVVFDASSKTSNKLSLNDTLLTGPPLQQDLHTILTRWRKYKIAVTADIEKMYRQIRIEALHCPYQKILWREHFNKPIEEYQLLTVTYGTACAPYLAIRTLVQLAQDEMLTYPLAAQKLLSEFYVDDLLTGTDTLDEAISLQTQLRKLLQSGGFNLRKWVSNSEALLQTIPSIDREIVVPFPIEFDQTVKALGLQWNPKEDTFGFKVSLGPIKTPVTKRSLLSDASKLFDPPGYLAPTTIIAKLMFQSLWIDGLNWDDQLPEPLNNKWVKFRNDLYDLEAITIPRWIHFTNNHSSIELHGFCDSSSLAYAAVIYSRCILDDGRVVVTLLTAKTKVAPIKQISIPRLELCAAHLLSKLVTKVKESMQISDLTVYGWTDSLNVLAWLRGHPRQWQTFVANRVSQIQETMPITQWNYVKSTENPADCASRGLAPRELKNHLLWWNGPSWLQKAKAKWPRSNLPFDTDLEKKKNALIAIEVSEKLAEIVERFSKLHKLLRVITYCFRFYTNTKTLKEKRRTGELTIGEIMECRQAIERAIQNIRFGEEMNLLKKKQPLAKSSKLYRLNPFIDEEGLLRVGGRIGNSQIAFNQKFPIILPEKHHFSQLVIEDCHLRTLHGGTQLTLNLIRKRYWILNARNAVRHTIHKCVKCFRYKASMQQQLMGNLPKPRVEPSRPFLHTGVDFSGYITIRESKCKGRPKTSKGYIAVFVCFSTKAVHLEFVSDLSTGAFLAAFRRFTSRRGLCSHIYSDCGTNFVGASQELAKAKLKTEYGINSEIVNLLCEDGIQWHFIPPAAPHFGGLWEAGVKSVKFHLKRILGESLLTFEEMATLLTQVEACLNSRPLCPLTNDADDYNALTPGHFLIGDALIASPEPSILDRKTNLLTRWHLVQRMVQDFWKRWISEYLPRLQNRPKWAQLSGNVKIGQLVIIKDERLPPLKWLLARVIEVHPGQDKLVRVVTLRTKDTILKRPISKICLLPITDNNDL